MPRIGVLGLEPFLVNQIDQLDRRTDAVLMDPLGDEDRAELDVDVVVVSRDHTAVGQLLSGHPHPPVVVVEDGVVGEEDVPGRGEPRRLQRPVGSPQLREAIDRSLGVPAWRRGLRSITIEQDDKAVPDRWLAVMRTLIALGALALGVRDVDMIGWLPLAAMTAWLVARALWWRLTPGLVAVDVLAGWTALVGWGVLSPNPPVALALLAAMIAAEAGFLWGWWRTLAGAVVLVAAKFLVWEVVFDLPVDDMAGGTSTVVVLLLVAAGAGAMAKRLWVDATQTRSSELRRFRSSLYELSRRQAVVAVSFDLGTVADDALSRLLSEVQPRAAMVLVADGPGPLQVAAAHNLASPPPVRLTWRPGLTGDAPDAFRVPATAQAEDGEAAGLRTVGTHEPQAADGIPEWRPSWARDADDTADAEDASGHEGESGDQQPASEQPSDDEVLAAFPDIDPGADLVEADAPTPDDAPEPVSDEEPEAPQAGEDRSTEVAEDPADEAPVDDDVADAEVVARIDDTGPGREPEVVDQAPPPAWAAPEVVDDDGPTGSLAQRLALRKAEAEGNGRTGDAAAVEEADREATPEEVDRRTVAAARGGTTSRLFSRVVQGRGRSSEPTTDDSDDVDGASDGHPSNPPGEQRTSGAYAAAGMAPPPATSTGPPPVAADAEAAPPSALQVAREQPEQRPMVLDRTTIRGSHGARLRDVVGQLHESLPEGPVLVEACELDGELMGALVVVAPTAAEPVAVHAEETALALDSVRLFNRLRAFTRDQERARIGRSLHDGVMQTLAHVAFELDRVSNDSWDESQVDTLGRLRDHVLGTVDEMRTVVNDLRTVRLDRGLPAALEAMALTLSPAGGPVIEVQAQQIGPQSGDIEEQFLRVAEEALNNAVQHSGARRVTVKLEARDGALLLQVLDDGFGFSQARVGDQDGGVGLTSMYQRARSIGAGLDIDTGANGTIVTLHHKLAPAPAPDPEPAQQLEVELPPSDPPARWWRGRP